MSVKYLDVIDTKVERGIVTFLVFIGRG